MLKKRKLPLSEVCIPEALDVEGWRSIRAHNAEDAAERWAEREGADDGVYYGDGNTGRIAVRKGAGLPVQMFVVSGSVSYFYSALEVEMASEEEE